MSKEKIYDENCQEYEGDGHLLIDNFNFYSVKTYKSFLKIYGLENLNNTEEENDIDSQKLSDLCNNDQVLKVKPIEGDRKYINCYPENLLVNYFNKKFNLKN